MLLKRSSLVIASAVRTIEEYLLSTISSKQNAENGNPDHSASNDAEKTSDSGAGNELQTINDSVHLSQEDCKEAEKKNTQPVVEAIQEQTQLTEAVRTELSDIMDSQLVDDKLAEDTVVTDLGMPELKQDDMSNSVIEPQSEDSIDNEWIKQSKPIYTEYGGLFFLALCES